MDLEGFALRWGPPALMGAGVTGFFGWLGQRAKAEPSMVGVSVDAMKVAYEHVQAELERMDQRDDQRVAEIVTLKVKLLTFEAEVVKGREDRHELRNVLQKADIYLTQVCRYARALEERQAAAGLEPVSAVDYGPDIERLMNGPIPMWRPDNPIVNRGE